MNSEFYITKLRLCLLFCAASAAILVWSGVAGAETATFNVAADTFINSGHPNNNAGSTGWFDAGRDGLGGTRRGLFRFDVSSIPAGATITSAEVQLTVNKVPGHGAVDSTFDLFRLQADWNEGSKGGNRGATASTGEATWNARMRNTENWTSPGAKDDAVATASASADVDATFNAKYSWSGAGVVDDVQFWVDNPSQNFGWLLANRAESTSRSVRGFASRENGNSARIGTLVVDYTTAPPPNPVPIENPIPESIVKGDITVELKPVVDGLTAPLGMAVPDDGSGRMFVYDQAGLAWTVTEDAGRLPKPLLDVSSRLVQLGRYDERGLLGLAAHPDFMQFPFIYTYTSEPIDGPADFVNVMPEGVQNNHQSVIAEWLIYPDHPNRVDPNSRREILRIDEPQSNHNGGTLRFGPDGYLYISLGDGGRANDVADGHVPGGNAQSIQRIYGKVIRIDVDGSNSANGQYGIPADNPFVGQDAVQEIFAYGLRNPYTYSFDSLTGDLYLGDAGQNNIEEVDLIVNGGNYGWNIKEGSFWFDSVTDNIGSVVTDPVRPVPPDLIDPIAEYDHDEGSVVVGGYVYRGTQIPALEGRYVFGDWGSFRAPSARLFMLDPNFVIEELRIGLADRPTGFWLRGFGQDANGELYVFGSTVLGPNGDTGQMFKLVPSLLLSYAQNNLISDVPDLADFTDPNLAGPWGIAADPNGLLWVANNLAGTSTAYDGDGLPTSMRVTIPPPAGSTSAAAVTGVVFNSTQSFFVGPNVPAELIYATQDGTIVGRNNTAKSVFNLDLSSSGAIYTGVAIGNSDGTDYLYAANFSGGTVHVFDTDFNPVTLAGTFSDPNLPAGFAPFNILSAGDKLYVTYALQDAAKRDAVPGPGNGYVNVFDTSGQFVMRLASEGVLDAPLGLALAPGGFGGLGGALLVGNFGDGRINAFNPATGEWLGELQDTMGTAISIEGLRGLAFGNSIQAGNVRTLYFTAGIADGNGLLGSIVSVDSE